MKSATISGVYCRVVTRVKVDPGRAFLTSCSTPEIRPPQQRYISYSTQRRCCRSKRRTSVIVICRLSWWLRRKAKLRLNFVLRWAWHDLQGRTNYQAWSLLHRRSLSCHECEKKPRPVGVFSVKLYKCSTAIYTVESRFSTRKVVVVILRQSNVEKFGKL